MKREFEKIKEGKSVQYEHRIVVKGAVKWVRIICEPLYNVDKRLIGYDGIVQDIDQWKIKELESNETKELLSKTERLGKIGSVRLNVITKEVVWSENVYQVLGVDLSFSPNLTYLKEIDGTGQNLLETVFDLIDGESVNFTQEHQVSEETRFIYSEFERSGDWTIGMVRDVTEEVLSKKALVESEEKYRFQSESLPHVLWAVDVEGHFTYLNQKGRTYFGLNEENFSGLKWFSFLHEQDHDLTRKKWSKAVQTKTQFSCHVRIESATGVYRWFMISASPMLDAFNTITSWIGIATDVHGQYLTQANLKESEEKFRTIFEQGNDAMLVLKDGFCLDCNKQVKSIFGVDSDEIKNKLLWKFAPAHQASGDSSKAYFLKQTKIALKSGESHFFYNVQKPNGRILHCEVNLSQGYN